MRGCLFVSEYEWVRRLARGLCEALPVAPAGLGGAVAALL